MLILVSTIWEKIVNNHDNFQLLLQWLSVPATVSLWFLIVLWFTQIYFSFVLVETYFLLTHAWIRYWTQLELSNDRKDSCSTKTRGLDWIGDFAKQTIHQ